MNVGEWIAHVDARRRDDELLRRGDWHGYLNDVEVGVLSGRYALARWAEPTVVVCHDDHGECLRLARCIENALTGPAKRPRAPSG